MEGVVPIRVICLGGPRGTLEKRSSNATQLVATRQGVYLHDNL
jgi:hypothetical protein